MPIVPNKETGKSDAYFSVYTTGLLEEIMNNEGAAILYAPMNIFMRLLKDVATRCSEVNDPELNGLMCQLALYEIANPTSEDYDSELCAKLMRERYELRAKKAEEET